MSGARGKRNPTSWGPGTSGNPGGRPNDAEIAQLCRKFTVDAVRTLVMAARLNPAAHPVAVTAANAILDRGWGKVGAAPDSGNAPGGGSIAAQHLLAVSAADPEALARMVEDDLADMAAQDIAPAEGALPGLDLLPQPVLLEPETAMLPLWAPRPAPPAPVQDGELLDPLPGEEAP